MASQYWSELIEILDTFESERVSFVLVAFFDESGIHDTAKICSMGGYMASQETWAACEDEWINILKGFGVRRFHSTDLASSRGEFTGWSLDQKTELCDRIVTCLSRQGMLAIGSSIILDDYRNKCPEDLKQRVQEPYFLCMEHCIQSTVRRMLDFWPPGERVAIYFDRQEIFRGRAKDRFEHYLYGRRYGPHIAAMGYVNPSSPQDFARMDAADLVAYETSKHLHNKVYDPTRSARKVFDRLWMQSSVDAKYFDAEAFNDLANMVRYVAPSDEPLIRRILTD